MRKLFLFIAAALVSTGMWAAPATSSDGKTVSGTVTFTDVTTALTSQTTYWLNGVKLYSYASGSQSSSNSLWTTSVDKGKYNENITAGSGWGSYTMSGLVMAQHAVAAHIKGEGTVTFVVNNNYKDQAKFDSNFKAYRVAANKYGDNYTTSTYKAGESGTEITSSLNFSCQSGTGRYTVTYEVTEEMLDANDEVIIKFYYGSSGTGAGKFFCYESVTFTPVSRTVTYNANGGTGTITDGTGSSITLSDGTGFTAPSGYTFAGWNTEADGSGTAYEAGATVTVSLELYAQWNQTVTLDANLDNHGTGDNGSATALYNGTELSNIVHTTPEEGFTLKGYYTAATEGVKVLNANGSFAATAITGYVVGGAWKKTGATTLYAQYAEPEKYSVAHIMTNVTSTGAYGADAATQGTDYVAVFTAKAEYSLPASITVTIGGVEQTEGEGYTYSAGTVTIPGAYVTGNIVITVEGVHNVCATPTITASTTFNFTNKGYAVTITNNEAGSTLKYSTDGTNWSDYSSVLYATTTTTFYAKSVKSNYADSKNASLEVTNSFDAEKKYVAWVYTSGYGGASYAFATDPMVLGLQADYNVIDVALAEGTNPTTATDIAEADLIVCTEAMQGGKTLSNNMKTYAGSTPMIGLKAYNYSKGRWSWGTPANPSSTTTSFKPKASNYKVLNGITFESDGSIKLATASSGNVIQTVQFGTEDCTAPDGNVIMGNIGNSDAKAVMYASTKYFGLGLSSDCWATYTDNAVTIVKNAAAMLIAGEALDALLYNVTISDGIQNGEVTADKAKAIAGETVTLTVTPYEGYQIASVKYNDGEDHVIEAENDVYSFTMPAANVTITATFSAINYTITCSPADHGSVVAKVNEEVAATATIGQTVVLTVSADQAYKIDKVKYNDGEDHEIKAENDVYSFTMPAANVTVTATFTEDSGSALDNTEVGAKAVKTLKNGLLIIEKNGVRYNMLGERVQ